MKSKIAGTTVAQNHPSVNNLHNAKTSNIGNTANVINTPHYSASYNGSNSSTVSTPGVNLLDNHLQDSCDMGQPEDRIFTPSFFGHYKRFTSQVSTQLQLSPKKITAQLEYLGYRIRILSSAHNLFDWLYTQARSVKDKKSNAAFILTLNEKLSALSQRQKNKLFKLCETYIVDLLCVSKNPEVLSALCQHGFNTNVEVPHIIFNPRAHNTIQSEPLIVAILKERTCFYRFEYAQILLSYGVNVDYNLDKDNAQFFSPLEVKRQKELRKNKLDTELGSNDTNRKNEIKGKKESWAGYLNLFFCSEKHTIFDTLIYEYSQLSEDLALERKYEIETIVLSSLQLLEKTGRIAYLSQVSHLAPTPLFFIISGSHNLTGVFKYLAGFERGYRRIIGYKNNTQVTLLLNFASAPEKIEYFDIFLKPQNLNYDELCALDEELLNNPFGTCQQALQVLRAYKEKSKFNALIPQALDKNMSDTSAISLSVAFGNGRVVHLDKKIRKVQKI